VQENYLFDTDAITNILKKQPSKYLIKKLKGLKQSQQNISTVTLSEIVYGAYRSPRPDFHLENLKKILLPVVNIVSFDAKAAYLCGAIWPQWAGQGNILAYADLQIASIAIANDFVLITGNIKHFNRIEQLKVENWLQ
jgi:predicted nucleic acid-binding protein